MPHIFQGSEGLDVGVDHNNGVPQWGNDGNTTAALARNSPATIRAVADASIDGAQILRYAFAASTAAYIRLGIVGATATSRCAASIYLRFNSAVLGAMEVLGFRNSSGNSARIGTNGAGTALTLLAANGTILSTSPALSPDVWYRIDLAATPGTTTSNGRMEYALYDRYGTTPLWSGDTGATVNAGTAALTFLQVGSSAPAPVAGSYDVDAIRATNELTSGFFPQWAPSRPFTETFTNGQPVPLHWNDSPTPASGFLSIANNSLRLTTSSVAANPQTIGAYLTKAPPVADSAGALFLVSNPSMMGGDVVLALGDRHHSWVRPQNGFSIGMTLNGLGEVTQISAFRHHANNHFDLGTTFFRNGLMLTGPFYFRLERIGQRFRYKFWSVLATEPTAWIGDVDTVALVGGAPSTRPVRVAAWRTVYNTTTPGQLDIMSVRVYDPNASASTPRAALSEAFGYGFGTPAHTSPRSAPTNAPATTAAAAAHRSPRTASTESSSSTSAMVGHVSARTATSSALGGSSAAASRRTPTSAATGASGATTAAAAHRAATDARTTATGATSAAPARAGSSPAPATATATAAATAVHSSTRTASTSATGTSSATASPSAVRGARSSASAAIAVESSARRSATAPTVGTASGVTSPTKAAHSDARAASGGASSASVTASRSGRAVTEGQASTHAGVNGTRRADAVATGRSHVARTRVSRATATASASGATRASAIAVHVVAAPSRAVGATRTSASRVTSVTVRGASIGQTRAVGVSIRAAEANTYAVGYPSAVRPPTRPAHLRFGGRESYGVRYGPVVIE